MSKEIPLIGRKSEISQIDNLIKDTDALCIVFLRGEGGLGKTRILQEVIERYSSNDQLYVSSIIDFDDRSLRTLETLEIRIGHELGMDSSIAEKIQQLRRFQTSGAIAEIVEYQRLVIINTLAEYFNQTSKNKRLVFLFDTIEKLAEDDLKRLLELISNFKNAVFLFAGRPRPEVGISKLMSERFKDQAYIINLQPLNQNYSKEYLKIRLKKLRISIKDDLIESLLVLAEGKLILIDLACQWLSISPAPKWLLDDLSTLSDKTLKGRKARFKSSLVNHVTKLRNPMDRLILILSRVYPADLDMIIDLLGMSKKDGDSLFENAKKYIFVKNLPDGTISLHDEMRKMIETYVWNDIDATKERRKRDSKIASKLFETRAKSAIKNFATSKTTSPYNVLDEERQRANRETLIEQWVEHALYADIDDGFEVFQIHVQQLRKIKEYIFAKRLAGIAALYYSQFGSDKKFDFDILNARLNNDVANPSQSLPKLRKLLKNYAESPEQLSSVLNVLGVAERIMGSYRSALKHQKECLKINEEINMVAVPNIANQVGFIYRLVGDIANAETYYKRGLDASMHADTPDQDVIASLLNNLGYVYGLQRKYDIAENHCLLAAEIWQKLGLYSEIARVDTTLAILHRDRGNYDRAIELLGRAITRLSNSSSPENIGKAYFHLAWAEWFKWEENNYSEILDWEETKIKRFTNIELLLEAKRAFDDSLEIAESGGASQILPGVLHQMSNVYWWLGWIHNEEYKQQARILNIRARRESEQRNNIRYWIDSVVGDAEFDFDAGDYERISHHADLLWRKYGKFEKKYSLYFGRVLRILGDIAFIQHNYDDALTKYIEAFPKIQQHGGFGKYSTRLELMRLERKLDKLPVHQSNHWLNYFELHWQSRAELMNWCEKERVRSSLRLGIK